MNLTITEPDVNLRISSIEQLFTVNEADLEGSIEDTTISEIVSKSVTIPTSPSASLTSKTVTLEYPVPVVPVKVEPDIVLENDSMEMTIGEDGFKDDCAMLLRDFPKSQYPHLSDALIVKTLRMKYNQLSDKRSKELLKIERQLKRTLPGQLDSEISRIFLSLYRRKEKTGKIGTKESYRKISTAVRDKQIKEGFDKLQEEHPETSANALYRTLGNAFGVSLKTAANAVEKTHKRKERDLEEEKEVQYQPVSSARSEAIQKKIKSIPKNTHIDPETRENIREQFEPLKEAFPGYRNKHYYSALGMAFAKEDGSPWPHQTISYLFKKDLSVPKKAVLLESVRQAFRSFLETRPELAQQVISSISV